MTTMHANAEVGADGKLRLEAPCDLSPGPVAVVVVADTLMRIPVDLNGAKSRSGLFEGLSINEADIDTSLKEMNDAWKAKLSDL